MTDIYHKAIRQALLKSGDQGQFDYQACKPYPLYWCTAERWNVLYDLFSQDSKFHKKFEAVRINRSKQQIRSTSRLKAHFLLRADMAKELGREPSLKEWCYKTHTHNDQ